MRRGPGAHLAGESAATLAGFGSATRNHFLNPVAGGVQREA
jgi:hypothetical protein